jgi:hypothetical protein
MWKKMTIRLSSGVSGLDICLAMHRNAIWGTFISLCYSCDSRRGGFFTNIKPPIKPSTSTSSYLIVSSRSWLGPYTVWLFYTCMGRR